ncbi:MAG: TolC family protein [Nitrospinota bacterium]|nr:TolC family protein [Nitrospinota bacterium]
MDRIITEQTAPGAPGSGLENPPLTGDVKITLDEALNRAYKRDLHLKKMELSVAKAMISKEESDSGLWPRLDIQSNVEWPISDPAAAEDTVFGGVYFRYSFKDALFAGDSAAVAQLAAHATAMNMEARKMRICFDLREKVARLEYLMENERLCGEKLEYVAQAGRIATALRAIGGDGAGQGAEWRAEAVATRLECGSVSREKRIAMNELRELINATGVGETNIHLAQFSIDGAPAPIDINRAVLEAWKNRPEVAALMDQLMAAEINARTAWRDRIPTLDISMGLGSIILQKDREEKNFVVGLGMSVPLFDAGASSRNQRRANILRDEKRLEVQELARKMASNISRAAEAMEAERELVNGREELDSAMAALRKEQELLTSAGRGSEEKEIQTRIAHVNSRMALAKSRYTLRRSILGWKDVTGGACVPAHGAGNEQ